MVWDWGSPFLPPWLQTAAGKLRLVKSDSDGSIFELAIPSQNALSAPH